LRRRIFIALIVLATVVVSMSVVKVYFVQDEGGASLLWNGTKAYVFVGIVERGYRFTYLTLIREWFLEIFPFGASPPSGKHFRALVLAVTPTGVDRYSFDNFRISLPPDALGQNIYAGNLLSRIPGPMKWTGTQFEPGSPEDQQEIQRAQKDGRLPSSPSYDNIGGWSRRMVGGKVEQLSARDYREEDAKVTLELDGRPVTLVMNSGFISRHAYIDLLRSGHAAERIWDLDAEPHRVSASVYKRMFQEGGPD
jgi:hypothetical protein